MTIERTPQDIARFHADMKRLHQKEIRDEVIDALIDALEDVLGSSLHYMEVCDTSELDNFMRARQRGHMAINLAFNERAEEADK